MLIDTDIRTWESSVSITQNFDLGLSGTFQLYLWMPDRETRLESNPDYSIQFANEGTWESENGYNNLLQTVSLNTTLSSNDYIFENNFSFYPNPSSDNIIVTLKELEHADIQIFDVNGRLIKEFTVSDNEKLDISYLSDGLYFLSMNNNTSSTIQFTKY